MGTSNSLPNVRTTSDLTIKVRLKDGGLAIDWTGLTDIKAWIYSDVQKAIAGRCTVSIDQADSTLLLCDYSAFKPQYLGVNRIIVQCKNEGRTKTYDTPALNFVPFSTMDSRETPLSNPDDIEAHIEVQDVSSSILDEVIIAALNATERANEAAAAAERMVDLHTGPAGADGADGADGKSAYELAVEEGYTGTEEEWLASLHGADGTDGTDGTDGKSAYEIAVDEGFVGTEEQWLASLKGEQGNTGSSVDYPFELVNNATTNDATKAATAAVAKGLKDDITQLEAKLNTLAMQRYYGIYTSADNLPEDASDLGYAYVGASAPFAIYEFDGEEWTDTGATINAIQGEPGADGTGITSFTSQCDGIVLITLTNGDTVTLDLNHSHPQYGIIVAGNSQPSGGFLPDIVYKLGTITGSVTFSLAAAVTGNTNHYFWTFDTDSTAPTITWPSNITWVSGSAPLIAASKHYEVSILDGIAAILEV